MKSPQSIQAGILFPRFTDKEMESQRIWVTHPRRGVGSGRAAFGPSPVTAAGGDPCPPVWHSQAVPKSTVSMTESVCPPPSIPWQRASSYQPATAQEAQSRSPALPPKSLCLALDLASEDSELDILTPLLQSATDQSFPSVYYSSHATLRSKKTFLLNGCRIQRGGEKALKAKRWSFAMKKVC